MTFRKATDLAKSFISKSQFLNGLQCHKALYLLKNHPEYLEETSESTLALFQSGKEVGLVARNLFPGGVEIFFDVVPISKQLKQTASEIKKGTKILYEPAFSHDGLFMKADIMFRNSKGWELYEVKSSTQQKDLNLEDIAFQKYVLKESGLPITKTFLIHINNEYVRQGDIEPQKLFTVIDLTESVEERQEFIRQEIERQRQMLSSPLPIIDIGEYCSSPYECGFIKHCWQHIPCEGSVFSLKGRGINKFDLYRQGIIHLKDIPITSLPAHAQMQVDCHTGQKTLINREALRAVLNTLWYPLCYLDFETVAFPIPHIDGTRPYQKIPFQYSLHRIDSEKAEPRHFEFLSSTIDQRKELLESLLTAISDNACIVAYNMAFEKGVLNSLKAWYPSYESKIERIISNLRDLMIPFKNYEYYSWQMQGSYSIKAVLPCLVPEMGYEGLEFSNGDLAMLAFKKMCDSTDSAEKSRLRVALLKYCELDSLAMVKIVENLITLCGGGSLQSRAIK